METFNTLTLLFVGVIIGVRNFADLAVEALWTHTPNFPFPFTSIDQQTFPNLGPPNPQIALLGDHFSPGTWWQERCGHMRALLGPLYSAWIQRGGWESALWLWGLAAGRGPLLAEGQAHGPRVGSCRWSFFPENTIKYTQIHSHVITLYMEQCYYPPNFTMLHFS